MSVCVYMCGYLCAYACVCVCVRRRAYVCVASINLNVEYSNCEFTHFSKMAELCETH